MERVPQLPSFLAMLQKNFSRTADNIFQTTCVKHQLLCVKHAQEMLLDRLFRIQLRKASWISANVAQSNLRILSYMEKESASPLNTNERNSERAKSMGHSELEMTGATGEKETSSSGLSTEPPSAP